eukprot:Skav200277  [mRNA]  locus=scaffold93:159100:169689:- [translate_table: standard]
MGGASSFVAMLAITGFLSATWTASRLSKAVGVSDIVLVIVTGAELGHGGVLLGPDIGGLISTEYSQCSHARHATECEVKEAAQRAVHVIGRLRHMALVTMAYQKPFFPMGVAAGTALAPTSVGIALRLLGEAGVLKEDFGQAAGGVEVLFNVLFSLGGEFDVVQVVVNPCVGVLIMLLAMYAAMKFWPRFITGFLMPKIPEIEGVKVARRDEVLFFLMFVVLLAYASITHFLGTHLWGCFIAGMSFACLEPPHHAHHAVVGHMVVPGPRVKKNDS